MPVVIAVFADVIVDAIVMDFATLPVTPDVATSLWRSGCPEVQKIFFSTLRRKFMKIKDKF